MESGPLWWAICAFVFLLQAVLVFRHEPFVDEWQALQIAVQSPDMAILLENLTYEGHPPLWHLFLRAIAVLAGPYLALPVAALVLGFATQYLILFRSPFPRHLRLLIALSEFVLFEFNTVSRSYTLGVMLVFLAVALWDRRRLFWIAIVLLPLTDFLFGVISVFIVWFRWRERDIWWPGAAAWVVAGVFAAWTVLPAPDVVPVYRPSDHDITGLIVWMARVSAVMLPYQVGDHGPQWDMPLPVAASMILWLPFIAICFVQTRGRFEDRVAIFAFLGLLLVFFVALYALMNRHVMLVGILLIVLQWRAVKQGHDLHLLFRAWLWIIAAMGLVTAGIALSRPFDTAPQAARKIRQLGLSEAHWAVYPAQHGQGISAMTGIRFEKIGRDCMQDVIRWDRRMEFDDTGELSAWLVQRSAKQGTFYFLGSSALPPSSVIRELARVPAGYDGKRYFLYRIGDGEREFADRLPACLPEMRALTDRPAI
ncbi:hypothetical protein [Croceicoccus bisphenolivorans]|uniref:hypothetical protein n=1 Tax=Croceicoccus bisphenolivorans TaxID=1783232 RepID=UPI001C129F21|nr:hypothetical protein [Croceicoccus bisphenolivorans]